MIRFILPLLLFSNLEPLQEADRPTEADFYEIVTVPLPDDVALEVGGLAVLPDGRTMACTRRGEVFIIDGIGTGEPVFHKFADGLQEPLGLLPHEGWIYVTQRGELSRMRDVDGDDRIDELETVCDDWEISGNYHEYNFGPRLGPDGKLWITTNKPFGSEPFGRVDWRGWTLRFSLDGEMEPVACGLRSPAGIGVSPDGDVFYSDNQGEWCGASKLSHVEEGDFHGHPWGIGSAERPEWPYDHPGDPPNGKLMPEVRAEIPSFKLPAVWFPYDKMGKSPAGFVWDQTAGAFGPFTGQVFIGDQHHASVMRVSLERVNGRWQGACYPFREGLQCGVTRVAFTPDNSLLVGMTNRGWGSKGRGTYGLQRIVWSGQVPFEVLEMKALADGFRLVFTADFDQETVLDPSAYRFESYTYKLHSDYGSPEVDRALPKVLDVVLGPLANSVDLTVDGLRAGYVHELHLTGVRSADGAPLLHPEAYYTLVELPAPQ